MNAQSPLDRTVAERLEALRETLDGARTMPMSSSVVVNKTDLAHLFDELEESVAQALGEAHDVLQQRDALVAAGEAEVESMLRDARLERDRLVADTEVFHSALREADRVRIDAAEEGRALREDAESYVAERLATFEETLDTTLEAVRRGRDKLTSRGTGRRRRTSGQASNQASNRANGQVNGQSNGQSNGQAHPMAALGDDTDVDGIRLPEHLER
jgi:TRAP-type C4-dicarboxylate transport system substrate-binding protein